MQKNSIYEQSLDTRVLIEILQSANEGDIVSYSQMSEAIGRPVNTAARHILTSARNYLEREEGIFTDTVTGVGVKRISPAQVVAAAPKRTRRRIARATNQAIRKLGRTPDDALTREELTAKSAALSYFGTLKHFTKESVSEAVKERLGDNQTLSVGTVIDLAKKVG